MANEKKLSQLDELIAVADDDELFFWDKSANKLVRADVSLFADKVGDLLIADGYVKPTIGTFSPTWDDNASGGTYTMDRQDGHYANFGDLCYFTFQMSTSNVSVVGSEKMRFKNLPFTAQNNSFAAYPVAIGYADNFGTCPAGAAVLDGQNFGEFYNRANTDATSNQDDTMREGDMTTGSVANGNIINVGGFYITA